MTREKLFIDGGALHGEGIMEFYHKLKLDDSWEIHSFEPNPVCHQYYERNVRPKLPHVVLHKEALYTYDGKITLRQENHKKSRSNSPDVGESLDGWASTVMGSGYEPPGIDATVEIPCIDTSEWLKTVALDKKIVIFKMDIEGSEFPVLTKMIKDRSFTLVNHFYIEFHERYFRSFDRSQFLTKQQIHQELKNNNIHFTSWG